MTQQNAKELAKIKTHNVSAYENVEQLEFIYIGSGSANWFNYCGTQVLASTKTMCIYTL